MNSASKTAQDDFEELISTLRAEGHEQAALRLQELLHDVAWTSASELTGELGLEILRLRRGNPDLSPSLQELLRRCMDAVKRVWPNMEKAPGM